MYVDVCMHFATALYLKSLYMFFVVQVLLGSTVTEALVYSENRDHCTPLHVAAQYGNLQ